MSIVGVVTAVTSAITGAVVSVVDSSLSSLQDMTVRLKRDMRTMYNYKWLDLHYTLDELITQDYLLRVSGSKI